MADFDIIIIGAGHNGLVAGTSSPRPAARCSCLNAATAPAASSTPKASAKASMSTCCIAGGRLRPDIVKDLGLTGSAVARATSPPMFRCCRTASACCCAPTATTPRHSRPFASSPEADAARWPEFVAFMDKAAAFSTRPIARRCRACRSRIRAEGLPLAKLALETAPARRQGHVPGDPQPVDVGTGVHRGLVRVGGTEGGDRRGRHSWLHPGIDVRWNGLHADPQLAQPRRAGATAGAASRRSAMPCWQRSRRTAGHCAPMPMPAHRGRQATGAWRAAGQRRGNRCGSSCRPPIRATRC